jgi:gliding motility-associated-like protein
MSGNPGTILSTGSSLDVSQTGAYVLEVTVGQCVEDDTAGVQMKALASSPLASKYTQCIDQVGAVTLDAGRGTIGVDGLTGMSYLWSGPGAGPMSTNQTFQVLPEYFTDGVEELTYTVTISNIYDYISCPVTDTVVVVDLCSPRVFAANAFHPGGTVLENSSFFVKTRYIKNFKITIFSRWGEIIYYSEDPSGGWDGKYRGQDMPLGVYAYIIEYEGKDETTKGPYRKEGKIVLVR